MLPDESIAGVLADVLRPGHFFVGPPADLAWELAVAETIPWEIFRGRLLDARQTRQEQTFLSWHIYWVEDGHRSGEPILSVKWHKHNQQLYIVRGLECYVWEGYQAEDNVYLSREVTKWVRELVGTVDLAQFTDATALHDELATRLCHAVVGLSRLPLTSAESPLPAFSLGRFGYIAACGLAFASPLRSARDLLERGLVGELSCTTIACVVELALRAATREDIADLAKIFAWRWRELDRSDDDTSRLLRTILNDISLSPWTAFVPNLLRFVQSVLPVGGQIDFLGHTLRQLARHLTAYDLSLFHHRGANYPDALLLDAVLKEYLRLCEQQPTAFLGQDGDARGKRLRRRALRQGWLLRRWCEGLPVPDAPTSPGENTRVLPPPHVRVAEEQILNPGKRRQRLYADDPLEQHAGVKAKKVLAASMIDLHHPAELREMGIALFIDRPLGRAKAPGEPDQTLLFSYEAFSRSIARQRLEFLEREVAVAHGLPWAEWHAPLAALAVSGLPTNLYRAESNRVVSLADANRLADDFLLLRTTPAVVREFLAQYPLGEVECLFQQGLLHTNETLIVPDASCAANKVELIIYDGRLQPCLRLVADLSRGYISRGDHELPAAGLRMVQAREKNQ